MSSGKVLLGIFAGAAVGAVFGILFAPEKGSVTRKTIAKKGEDYTDTVQEKLHELLGNLTRKFEKVEKEVSNLAEKHGAKFEERIKEPKTTTY